MFCRPTHKQSGQINKSRVPIATNVRTATTPPGARSGLIENLHSADDFIYDVNNVKPHLKIQLHAVNLLSYNFSGILDVRAIPSGAHAEMRLNASLHS